MGLRTTWQLLEPFLMKNGRRTMSGTAQTVVSALSKSHPPQMLAVLLGSPRNESAGAQVLGVKRQQAL
jgi:hypothetical protein